MSRPPVSLPIEIGKIIVYFSDGKASLLDDGVFYHDPNQILQILQQNLDERSSTASAVLAPPPVYIAEELYETPVPDTEVTTKLRDVINVVKRQIENERLASKIAVLKAAKTKYESNTAKYGALLDPAELQIFNQLSGLEVTYALEKQNILKEQEKLQPPAVATSAPPLSEFEGGESPLYDDPRSFQNKFPWKFISYKEFVAAGVNFNDRVDQALAENLADEGKKKTLFGALANQIVHLEADCQSSQKRLQQEVLELQKPQNRQLLQDLTEDASKIATSPPHKEIFIRHNILQAEFKRLTEARLKINAFKQHIENKAQERGLLDDFNQNYILAQDLILDRTVVAIPSAPSESDVFSSENIVAQKLELVTKTPEEINQAVAALVEDDARSEAPETSIIVPEVFVRKVQFQPAAVVGPLPAPEPVVEKLSKEKQEVIRGFVDEVAKLSAENRTYEQLQQDIIAVMTPQYDKLNEAGLLRRYTNLVPALTKDEQIAKAAKDYAIFGKLCKDEDYAVAVNFNADAAIDADDMKDWFHSLIGLERSANEVDGNNISWVDSDNITSQQNAQNVSGVEMFFHQRLMIQANVRNLEKEFELEKQTTPDLEKSGFLAQRFAVGAVDDERTGLAKIYNGDLVFHAGSAVLTDEREFTNQGLAMQMAFFQAQEQELQRLRRFGDNPLSAQMLEVMTYRDFALIANLIGRAKNNGVNDIGADLSAVLGGETSSKKAKEVFFFYENYVYANASKAAAFELGDGGDEQFRIAILREAAQRLINANPVVLTAKVRQELENLLEPEEGSFSVFDEENPVESYNKGLVANIPKLREILFPYILHEKKNEILNSFINGTAEDNKELFDEINSYESNLALGIRRDALENANNEFFESRKERRLQRAEKSPPKLADVHAARIGIGASLSATPTFIINKEKGIASPNHDDFSHQYDYQFKDLEENLVETKTSEFKERQEIDKANLDQYLTAENNFGDRSLFAAANKLHLVNGFVVADFTEPSCLADFAQAVDKMPNDFAKAELAAGRPVFNIASLSGDDGQNRKNKVALIRQLPGYDAPIVTFTTPDILERSISKQSENFFEQQLKAEAQIANLQQMADITTVYLNDFIAKKYREGKADGSAFESPEEVLALPEVKELSRLNYYMQACIQKFAFKEGDSLKVRNKKIADLQQFMESPLGMPRVLESGMEDGSEIKKLPDLLAKISANFAKQEGKAAGENADSSLAKRFAALSEQMTSQEKSVELSGKLVARAKKSANQQMQQYLQGKEIAAAKTSELKIRLTDSDVKKMQGDFYRLNSVRPDFTKGGKTEFDALLTSEIPKSPFPGISIYKPKGLYGKAAKALVSFDLPSDPAQLADFDDIAWIYLPGTPECYIKARVAKEDGPISYYKDGKLLTKQCKAGEVLIDEGVIYRKGENATYMPISAEKEELKNVFGKSDGAKVAKTHEEFSVLAVSSFGGERRGVSTLFRGEAINKDTQQVTTRVAAVNTSLETQRSANLECKFGVGSDGRIASNSNLKDFGIVGDYGLKALKERGREFIDEVGGQKLSDYVFQTINEQGLNIDGLSIPVGKISENSLKIYHGVNMRGSKKAIAIDPPIVVLSYEAADGSKKEVSFQLDKENFKKIVMSNGTNDATADSQHAAVANAIANSRQKDFAQVLDCKPASVKDGVELPPEFGEFKDGFKPEELRIVRQVIATRESKKDVLSLGELLIEYYPPNPTSLNAPPSYMALTKENLQKLYKEDISDETYQKFAAELEARSQVGQYSVLMDDGKTTKTLTIKDGDNLEVTPKKVSEAVETPHGTCRPVEASLFLGNLQAVAQTGMVY